MEEMSPPVAVALSLDNPICENLGVSNRVEITRLKLDTGTATLLSDPAAIVLDDNSNSGRDAGQNCVDPEVVLSIVGEGKTEPHILEARQITENGQLVHEVQESEEDETLSVGEEPSSISSVDLLPLGPTPDLSVPLDTASETSLPIAVEIEGTENGQILAKVISLEERSIKRRLSDGAAGKPDEACSSGPTIKASVVAVKLSSEKDSSKGGVKSVFELDCLPLWGSVSICGHRPEMEDAVIAVPDFMKIPIKMFIGDHGIDGISQTLTHLTSHFFGVYDGHGGSQVHSIYIYLILFHALGTV